MRNIDRVFPALREIEWQESALCRQTDPEAFFPEKGASTREAKLVCSRCDVRGECLKYALDHDERFGVWGGMSERERRKLKRREGVGGTFGNSCTTAPDVDLDEDDEDDDQVDDAPAALVAA